MSEFNEFKPRLKSPKNQFQFQLSAGLNLKKLNTILMEPTIFEPLDRIICQICNNWRCHKEFFLSNFCNNWRVEMSWNFFIQFKKTLTCCIFSKSKLGLGMLWGLGVVLCRLLGDLSSPSSSSSCPRSTRTPEPRTRGRNAPADLCPSLNNI